MNALMQVPDLAAAVNLKAEHLPEGYAAVSGPCVRLHRLPGLRLSSQTATITADEADAWALLFQRAAEEARAADQSRRAEESRDESGCELTTREVYGVGR